MVIAWGKKREELVSFPALLQIFCRTSNKSSEAVELDGQQRVGQSSVYTNSARVRNEGGKIFSALGTYFPCLKVMGRILLF